MCLEITDINYLNWPVLRQLGRQLFQFPDGARLKIHYDRVYCLSEGRVYAHGPNVVGCLGVGHEQKVEGFQSVEVLANRGVIDIICSRYFDLALTSTGQVWAWGRFGSNMGEKHIVPTRLVIDARVVSVRAGLDHVLMLTTEGRVYSWGRNDDGLLGVPANEDVDVDDVHLTPVLVSALETQTIAQIDCGVFHSLAITDDGRVFTWGRSVEPGRAAGAVAVRWQPIEVSIDGQTISAVACGFLDNMFLTTEGRLYSKTLSLQAVAPETSFEKIFTLNCNLVHRSGKTLKLAYSSCEGVFLWDNTQLVRAGHSLVDVVAQHASHPLFPTMLSLRKPTDTTVQCPRPVPSIGRRLLSLLVDSFDDPNTGDVEFYFPREQRSLFALRLVLVSMSSYMSVLISSRWQGHRTRIEIATYSYAHFHGYIKWLYTDMVEADTLEQLLNWIDLAECFDDVPLKARCCQLIQRDHLHQRPELWAVIAHHIELYNLGSFFEST